MLPNSRVRSGTSNLKSVVAKVQIAALAIFISAVPGLAAETVEWGQPVNGLRLSISMAADPSANLEMQVTFQDVSDQNLLVPIGAVVGNAHPMLLKLYVTTANGKTHRILQGGLPGVAGYMEPWNISLRPQESYTARMPISSYFVLDGSEKLETLILRHSQLWVEIDHQSAECMVPKNLAPVPCWHGRVSSNTLRLPN
jgi:hypothetical protein